MPHAPQFVALVCRFTHTPPHAVWPVSQMAAHAPLTHCCPAAQRFPHAPQLFGSSSMLEHPLGQASESLHVIPPPGHPANNDAITNMIPAAQMPNPRALP